MRHFRRVPDDGTATGNLDGTLLIKGVSFRDIDLGPAKGNPRFELSSIGIPTTDPTSNHTSDKWTHAFDSSIGSSLPLGVNEFNQFRHFLLSHGIFVLRLRIKE